MIPLQYQIILAVALDLLIGDPRWLPHPVKLIGRSALWLEGPLRRVVRPARLAGIIAVIIIVGGSAAVAWAAVLAASMLHPWAGSAVSIILMYTTIAARDLADHSMRVFRPLHRGDLAEARKQVSMIVGRDTAALDGAGVARAAVESVAESTVDGVTAPIFFAIIGGPIGAIAYRAVNTLDSTFGYKNERYLQFGWASARLDDVANYLPARITGLVMVLAAAVLARRPVQCLRTLIRDARKHESPNAGFAEAAMAGALGVQLGGVNYYNGEALSKPTIGQALVPLSPGHILWANAMMWATMLLFTAAGLAIRAMVVAAFW